MCKKNARLIAFYLPQYHPIPENDRWWGKGFTEWTNVRKAQPLFAGHNQPRIPGTLGYYDLRDPAIRSAQAELAQSFGIEGFCYWHYWFAGKRLLERPFKEVLESGEPAFPFCLGWANDSWTGIWHGAPGRILIRQTYPGEHDEKRHFYELLDAFRDPRYMRIDGKPIFLIYRPVDIPHQKAFIQHWNELARKGGMEGIYFLASVKNLNEIPHCDHGFSGIVTNEPSFTLSRHFNFFKSRPYLLNRFILELTGLSLKKIFKKYSKPYSYAYSEFSNAVNLPITTRLDSYPCIVPNWDNTSRCGIDGIVLKNSSPALFQLCLRNAINRVKKNTPERRIVFIKSWNEWAEGNYLEPDQRYGYDYLQACREEVFFV